MLNNNAYKKCQSSHFLLRQIKHGGNVCSKHEQPGKPDVYMCKPCGIKQTPMCSYLSTQRNRRNAELNTPLRAGLEAWHALNAYENGVV